MRYPRFVSTRGNAPALSFSKANMKGMAPGGGLYVSDFFPSLTLDRIKRMKGTGFVSIASDVLPEFVDPDDISHATLCGFIEDAYNVKTWGGADITPVRTLTPGLHVLELFRGPTLAFKDVAMQLVGKVLVYVAKRNGETIVVIVATSGDTGSAAIEALKGMEGVTLFVLFPDKGTSGFQRAQITTPTESNLNPIAIRAPFDPCQKMTKELLQGDFQFELNTRGVNSIAFGRTWAQITYFFDAYLKVANYIGEVVTFVVPSGNMGDFYAGWMAKMMGLPINLVIATNENRILVDFVETGRYRPRSDKELVVTDSPSMDIQLASNQERWLFDIVGRDTNALSALMRHLAEHGYYNIARTPHMERLRQSGVRAGSSTLAERQAAIREVRGRYKYLIDPHTANAYVVAMRLGFAGQIVILATASPTKFEEAMRAAGITDELVRPARYVGIEERPESRLVTLDADIEAVKAHIRRVVRGS